MQNDSLKFPNEHERQMHWFEMSRRVGPHDTTMERVHHRMGTLLLVSSIISKRHAARNCTWTPIPLMAWEPFCSAASETHFAASEALRAFFH